MLNKKKHARKHYQKVYQLKSILMLTEKKWLLKTYTILFNGNCTPSQFDWKQKMVSNDVFLTTYRSTATEGKWIRQIDEYYNFWQLPNKITRQSIKRTWTRLKWSIFNAANKKEKTREFQLCFNKTSTRKQFLTDKVIYTYL